MRIRCVSPLRTMHEGKTNISVRQTARRWLLDGMNLLVEALVWMGCFYLAALTDGIKPGAGIVPPYIWFVLYCYGLAFLFVVSRFIPNNACSRTARRDEVVAQAMKTALACGVLAFAVFTERNAIQITGCLFFFVALATERLVTNSWFIRYSLRHGEQGVIICNEETAWQLEALQQNTYGLKLNRLEMQAEQEQLAAQRLEVYLGAHPETESVYISPLALHDSHELEDIAHICRKQGQTFHLLPIAPRPLPQTMQSEGRGTVGVLSPAKLPLQSFANRAVKRLTDIVLSLIVLLTIFPVFAVIAFILIKRQSKGPVLEARHLCGMDGKTFLCLTFRTRHYEAAPSFLDGADDPGYFPFGRFLTNTRLELLPQFLCVLWGSMTIVGSQAMPPEQYANYKRELRQLFATGCHLKAGITNPSLSAFHSSLTEADVWYSRNWGFWLDLRIMLQRLGTLLSKSKAKSINYI